MIAPRTLEDLQDAVTYRLLGDEFLADVTILKEQYSSTTDSEGDVLSSVEDIETRVLNALASLNTRASKMGAVCVVMMPEVDATNPNVPGVQAKLVIKTRCIVNPLFNNGTDGTRKSEGQLALRVSLALHQWLPGFGNNVITLAPRGAIAPINGDLPPGNNGYEVEHHMQWGVAMGAKVSAPLASVSMDDCTLTCATDGAAILYTRDGSLPSRGNTSAHAYEAPFVVVSGDIVKCAASKADAFESDTTTFIVT